VQIEDPENERGPPAIALVWLGLSQTPLPTGWQESTQSYSLPWLALV
jgi:hypothetical protein